MLNTATTLQAIIVPKIASFGPFESTSGGPAGFQQKSQFFGPKIAYSFVVVFSMDKPFSERNNLGKLRLFTWLNRE